MGARVITMPDRRPVNRLAITTIRFNVWDQLICAAIWIGAFLSSAGMFCLIGHWIVVIARHVHHSHLHL